MLQQMKRAGEEENEKTKFKDVIKKKKQEKEEQEELCGPRLQLKINRMLKEFNQDAGLDDYGNRPREEQLVDDMMRTGNTSLFKVEMNKNKNTNEDGYQGYVQTYGEDVKAAIAFY